MIGKFPILAEWLTCGNSLYFLQVTSPVTEASPKRPRLTKSLISGSDKSLSVSYASASMGGSIRPSVFSGPFMMRTAEDAASNVIDFAKGDVEDGVVDSPPSRGPGRTPICSPSPLKRASSTQGCSFSPTSRADAGVSRKLDLHGGEATGDPRGEGTLMGSPARMPSPAIDRGVRCSSEGYTETDHVSPGVGVALPRVEGNRLRLLDICP